KRRLNNKRKYLDLNKNNLLVDQFILSPRNLIEESRSSYPIRTYRKKLKRYNMSTDHWEQTSKLLPNYKQLSPFKFKQILLKAISNEYRNELNQLLNNIATLQFIKKRAELLCMVFQLKIEQDYWNYIGTLNMPTITWLSLKTSKVIIKQNFINWDHTKTITYIQRQQNKINNKLQKAIFNLYVHFEQAFPLNERICNVMSLDDLSKIIYSALAIILEKSLHYFHLNFEQKEILLYFDIQDAYLVKSFFDLNPTLEQIVSFQNICRTYVKSQKKLLRQKKKQHINGITFDETIYQECPVSCSMEIFNDVLRTIINARQTNLHQRTQQIMKFVTTIDNNEFF
ncbi:unnamed protein product, partial [Adineta steineri]